MNKRLKELALEAGYTPDMFGVGHWDMPECKKFAELIVLECMYVGRLAQINNQLVDSEIKDHFGVES